MAVTDIDFEGAGNQGSNSISANNSDDNNKNVVKQDDVTNLSGNEVDDVTNKDGNIQNNEENNNSNTNDDNPSTGELNVGDVIEFDGITYTVDKNGNLVDDKGAVFKEAKDVSEWLKTVDVEDNKDQSINISSIKDALGVTITDENGKEIEFSDNPEGVKSYINSVIALRSNELQEAAINRLYQDNPLLKQFQDYVQLTGSPRGFGEIPDRRGIKLDKDNEQQLIAVIKMAAQEFGNKSLNDTYIKYLKDSGGLFDEAKNQLDSLIEKDNAYRKEIEQKAEEQRRAQAQATADYWNSVNRIVESRQIGTYRIPESFTKEVNGKKVVITPKDFFNYISSPIENSDGSRSTAYQNDLSKLTDEEYLNRELVDAWLMFTGGTYKDLIDMAVKEEEVRKLRVKAKDVRSTKTAIVIKKSSNKSKIDDIIL